MQAFTDVPVNCCDCEKTFLSASSLLQHFAEHVKIKLAKDNYDKLKLISRKSYRKRFFNNNNEEEDNVTKNGLRSVSPVVFSSSSSSDSSNQSLVSDKSYVESLEQDASKVNADEEVNKENSESICATSCETGKDVENSIFKNCNDEESKQFCIEFNSEKMLINIERFSKEAVNESDDSLKRKLSNRKQSTPKKIERVSSGLIKIAPKPKDMPVALRNVDRKQKQKRKYNCHLCVKSFGWSTDLKRHILVHTGERPFKCNKCDACFTRNFLLQKHKNKIHPNNKEELEKNKLLEEKVNENLKQLKSKMNQLNSVVLNDEYENIQSTNYEDEEMIFNESKLGIKEETSDPLSLANESFKTTLQEHYVNGNWFLANNIDIKETVIKKEDSRCFVSVGNTGET